MSHNRIRAALARLESASPRLRPRAIDGDELVADDPDVIEAEATHDAACAAWNAASMGDDREAVEAARVALRVTRARLDAAQDAALADRWPARRDELVGMGVDPILYVRRSGGRDEPMADPLDA